MTMKMGDGPLTDEEASDYDDKVEAGSKSAKFGNHYKKD